MLNFDIALSWSASVWDPPPFDGGRIGALHFFAIENQHFDAGLGKVGKVGGGGLAFVGVQFRNQGIQGIESEQAGIIAGPSDEVDWSITYGKVV